MIVRTSLAFCSAVLFLSTVLPVFATGGAWVREEGGYYVKFGVSSLTADEQYNFDGNLQPLFPDTTVYRNGTFGITDVSVYAELGITNWLTGTISTQYKVAVREAEVLETGLDETTSSSGLGDIWLGGRFQLLPDDKPFAGAATVSLKLPTGSPNQEVPLGTGVLDYEVALAGGTGFPVGNTHGYTQLSAGYRLRNSASNELNYQVEVGVKVFEPLMVQAFVDGTYSTADFDRAAADPDNVDVSMQLVADQSFTRLNGGLIYDLAEDMELNVNYSMYASGINSLSGNTFSVGIAWKK